MSIDMAIIGLGYVGLPLAQQAVRSGLTVVGFDVNDAMVATLMSGASHVDGARGHGIEQITFLLGHGEHHDAGVAAARAGHLDASAFGHVEVADHQVGTLLLDDGDGPGRVAVERRVADGRLALVAGGEHHPAELVRQRHERDAADT